MKQYLQDVNEVFHDINATDSGLSSDEAEIRLTTNGKNKLVEPKKVSILRRFLNQLKDPMIIILLVAAVVSGVLAIIEKEFPTDVIIIMCVVLLNSILGVVQENKAENAIEALKKMTAATSKVIRDNKLEHIKSEDLVVGDIVILEAGDAVPADCRIIECASLKIEESALTGESVPVNKQIERLTVLSKDADVSLGDRKNMVYMGSSVVYGRGRAVVVATGMDTEMGKIANVISNTMDDATPLQKKLNGLSKILTYLVIGICVFIFVFTLIKTGDFGAASIINTFMIAISLAVAAIPEGLATVVTIVLSIGVTKMSKRNAVVRKLTAVEALGCTQVICSDKTGTLTQNKMTVVDSYTTDKCLLAKSMALCSDSELDENNDATGEPTENALVNFAYKENLPKPELKKQEPRVSEAPFDSMRKMMSTLHQKDVIVVQYTKGAPDELLKVCSFALEKGKIVPLTDKIKQEILAQNKHMADKALRVLASAYKEYPTIPTDVSPEKIEKDLIFIGLVGMIDPIRPEVKDAIALCRTAGIRPVMITGDHRDTAIAIAQELGII
ncbi:MAG: HAD-IC family P-type ATPase, partial [Clostridia bacterium]